jgi:hypothetical protein
MHLRKPASGLTGDNRAVADALVADLNRLLRDPSLHTPAARAKAESLRIDPLVVEIFYGGTEAKRENYRALRDKHLPFPPREEGYPRMLLLGVPGAGKTTLVRQFIGSHPKRDGFPSTSVNRTTTCETEVIVGLRDFSAAVTFMSEEEADFEIRQSVSSALLRAVDETSSDADVAKAFLERSDMRFRLKYVLGDWTAEDDDDDPYKTDGEDEGDESDEPMPVPSRETEALAVKLRGYVSTIRTIAISCREEIEKLQDPIHSLLPDERNTALDWLQELAEESDAYIAFVSDILDDLRDRFKDIAQGRLVKTTTGWPRMWLMDAPAANRSEFLRAVRFYSGIDRTQWGRLLTPLVNGIRVAGPFVPLWAEANEAPRLVLIDTEGLGHKANVTADVPEHIVGHFTECDAILLVHKGDVPFTFEGGKVLEAIGAAGQTAKTMMVFSRMDAVKGDNIKGWQAKRDYVFSGVRNVLDHQIAKSLTPDIARFMAAHLESNSFYLGSLHEADPRAARAGLSSLLKQLTSIVPLPATGQAFPEYNYDLFVLALQKGVEGFRTPWRAYLDIERHSDLQPLPWQSVKAVSRRYAEGFDDGYPIRPASNLLNTMTLAIGRFLESPVRWKRSPTPEERRMVLDRIKAVVSEKLRGFCVRQVRESPKAEWQQAYAFRGDGSTFDRKIKIEALYQRWVPVPAIEALYVGSVPVRSEGVDDAQNLQTFIKELNRLVRNATKQTQDALVNTGATEADKAD